jgi:epoxyqueuosine reductase QueG
MNADSTQLAESITTTIRRVVTEAGTATDYREPLVAFVAAHDPRFADLRRVAQPTHIMPDDLLTGARSVISFFLPFDYWVVEANAQDKEMVAREWAEAYVETNRLIERITKHLIESLAEQGIRAAAEPPTHNFDPISLVSHWPHKSIAVIAGLGSFGLHHMVITDSGCAGRCGSLVIDADLPISPAKPKERCLYFHDGSCLECILRCPVNALDETDPIDRQCCNRHLRDVAKEYEHLDLVGVCGKCAIGPCSFESAVQ